MSSGAEFRILLELARLVRACQPNSLAYSFTAVFPAGILKLTPEDEVFLETGEEPDLELSTCPHLHNLGRLGELEKGLPRLPYPANLLREVGRKQVRAFSLRPVGLVSEANRFRLMLI